MHQDTCTRMFTEALFVMTPSENLFVDQLSSICFSSNGTFILLVLECFICYLFNGCVFFIAFAFL
jgi:hypothetical protein